MLITRQSPWSGKVHTLDLSITDEQVARWMQGELIQNAMSNLTDGQREFFMTGITKEEWEEAWGSGDDA